MNTEDAYSDNADLLQREPKELTERELEHMEVLAEVVLQIFTREQQPKQESVVSLDTVLASPRVFAAASIARN